MTPIPTNAQIPMTIHRKPMGGASSGDVWYAHRISAHIPVISATIPVVYVATIAVMSLILGYDPVTMILTGGVLLGGIFMLTDYATSPSTEWGKVVLPASSPCSSAIPPAAIRRAYPSPSC